MNKMMVANAVRAAFNYDPATGELQRLFKNGTVKTVGSLHKSGYVQVAFDGRVYYAHRLIWLIVHGCWPTGEIDHKNGIRSDNAWTNLRDVSASTNQQNQRLAHAHSLIGMLGVSPKRSKFRARIRIGASQVSLGTFVDPREAHSAYVSAKRLHHDGCTL